MEMESVLLCAIFGEEKKRTLSYIRSSELSEFHGVCLHYSAFILFLNVNPTNKAHVLEKNVF